LFGYAYRTHLQLLLSPKLRKVPVFMRGDSHNLGRRQTLKNQLTQWSRNLMFKRFSAFLAVGHANVDYYRASGVPAHKIFLTPHCVDNKRFMAAAPQAQQASQQWRQTLEVSSQANVILFAGKFEDKKRPLDLLHAFQDLAQTAPDLFQGETQPVLLFVGAGPLESELKQIAQQTPHLKIVFQGFQNQAAMPRTYAIADIVVLPSYGSGETWGLAINEAMCMGKPVIVSSHVGCATDLVHPNRNGLIFPAGERSALTQSLATALSNPQRLKQWGRESRNIIAHYSYTQATQGLQKALSACLLTA
jgi:glycosyltransferase involved in cell wall biosynthesis